MTVDLAALPTPGSKRMAVRVTKDALRHIRHGHPWVYEDSIDSVSHRGAPGDLAVIFDDDRKFAAIGMWDPASPICIKILHAGKPATIDATFWDRRVAEAVERRRPLLDDPDHNAYRLIHGENDAMPGIVVDDYNGVVVAKIYTDGWIPHLADLVPVLVDRLVPRSLIIRFARSVEPQPSLGLVEGAPLHGPPPAEPVMFLENGLTFEAHPTTGQKTGHFLDQRDNRALVRGLARGRRVLDVFSCTGGFTVHAAAGGATEVHSVDLSRPALDAAERNMAHNRPDPAVAACDHLVHHGDAFEVMEGLLRRNERFDFVIIDPPSFAQRQASVDGAMAAYERLSRLGFALTCDGGTYLQASCSSRVPAEDFFHAVHFTARREGVEIREFDRTGHPLDHPIGFAQGAYLKALYATVHH
ncbi:MAG: class I SAM-dependent methyltransferase [Acidimicrobiales bacterium]